MRCCTPAPVTSSPLDHAACCTREAARRRLGFAACSCKLCGRSWRWGTHPSHHILSSKLCSQPIRIIGAPRGPGERHVMPSPSANQLLSILSKMGRPQAPPTHPTGRASNVRGLSRSCNVIRIPESAGPLPVTEQNRSGTRSPFSAGAVRTKKVHDDM